MTDVEKEILQEQKLRSFNHSVAFKTEWTPLGKVGSSFRSEKLVFSKKRIKVATTFQSICIITLLTLMPALQFLWIFFTPLVEGIQGESTASQLKYHLIHIREVLPLLGGKILCFIIAILLIYGLRIMVRRVLTPRVFDKTIGFYYRGKLPLKKTPLNHRVLDSCKFEDITAIQVIEHEYKANSPFYMYETNIVLRDSSRIHVLKHGDEFTTSGEAHTLANFLNVPLWDMTT